MAVRPLSGLALCAGVGGLELGLRLALGDAYRAVGYVEREAFAAAALVARMEEAVLDPAPVWDDLTTFDGHPWRGRVDLVSGGFPCQPWSDAGQKLGFDDERWLWPDIARILEEVAPQVAFFENVPPLAARGLDVVLGDLARLGFDAEWSCLSAAAVGATHKRERFWVLAYRDGCRLPRPWWEPGHDRLARDDVNRPGRAALAHTGRPGRPEVPRSAPGDEGADARGCPNGGHISHCPSEDVAHPEGVGGWSGLRQGRARQEAGPLNVTEPADTGSNLADTAGAGLQGPFHGPPQRGPGPAWDGDRLPFWPPGPDDRDGWERVRREAGPEPSVRRVADGLADRLDRLHAIGNGVVPLVAAHAFVGLARRAGLIGGGVT